MALPPYKVSDQMHLTIPALRKEAFAKFRKDAAVFWDIGAGCGQLGIRWLQEKPHGIAYAIENNPELVKDIIFNKVGQEQPGLIVVERDAGLDMSDLTAPDAIYLGCLGWSDTNLATHLYQYLAPGGTIVAFGLQETALKHIQDALDAGIGQVKLFHPEPTKRNMRCWYATKPL